MDAGHRGDQTSSIVGTAHVCSDTDTAQTFSFISSARVWGFPSLRFPKANENMGFGFPARRRKLTGSSSASCAQKLEQARSESLVSEDVVNQIVLILCAA